VALRGSAAQVEREGVGLGPAVERAGHLLPWTFSKFNVDGKSTGRGRITRYDSYEPSSIHRGTLVPTEDKRSHDTALLETLLPLLSDAIARRERPSW